MIYSTVVYRAILYEAYNHAQLVNSKHKIVINWNFGNKIVLFVPTNLCHKKEIARITEYPFK